MWSSSAKLLVLAVIASAGVVCFAALPAITCPKGDPGVACLVNPCTVSQCKPKKNWECVPNYCTKTVRYLGNTIAPGPSSCSAVWIEKPSLKAVTCPAPEACIELYAPVCGTDGKTYSNSCFAAMARVAVDYPGKCTALPPIKCPKGDPGVQCLVDPCKVSKCKPKKNWECVPNYCTKTVSYLGNIITPGPSRCSAVWIEKPSKKVLVCPAPVGCPKIYKPVCGTNGKTYPNACIAAQARVAVRFPGLCVFPPKCEKVYKPVCDSLTRTTWTNACTAKANGVTSYTKGACLEGKCAKCLQTNSCELTKHRCKGNKKYRCTFVFCEQQHILDSGERIAARICRPFYYSVASGFPAAKCYP